MSRASTRSTSALLAAAIAVVLVQSPALATSAATAAKACVSKSEYQSIKVGQKRATVRAKLKQKLYSKDTQRKRAWDGWAACNGEVVYVYYVKRNGAFKVTKKQYSTCPFPPPCLSMRTEALLS